jgi:hypothetical protein
MSTSALWCGASLLGLLLTCYQAGVRGRELLVTGALSTGIALVATPLAVWGKSEGSMNWELVALFMPLVLIIVFITCAMFKHRDRLLPRIHEGSVLALTVVFYYCLFRSQNPVAHAAVLFFSPFAAVAVASAFTPWRMGKWLRFTLSGWYSFMCLVLGTVQAVRLFTQDLAAPDTLLGFLGVGMLASSLLILGAHLSLLLPLLPIKAREQTYAHRWREILRDSVHLSRRVDQRQLPALAALGILALYVAPLALNARFAWVPDAMALSTALSLGPPLLAALARPASVRKDSIPA